MANNREHMSTPSSTLGLPEKLFLFRERLQKWMWSSQEGLQLIGDLNVWRRETDPEKEDIKAHDNEELASVLAAYLAAFEQKKGWDYFKAYISHLLGSIAKAEEIHSGLLFILSLEQSLEDVVYHPLSEDVNVTMSSSAAHFSQADKERLKRNAAKINPLSVLDAPVPQGSFSATLQQSRQSMRWYHITCWFSAFRRVIKEIWEEIHPVQQQVQAARRRSNSSPQRLEGQPSAIPSPAGPSQKNVIEFRLAVSVAQHKLNRVQKRFADEAQRLFGRQIEENQLNEVWQAEVAGSSATEQKWEWFGYRSRETKERREYLLRRRLMQHLGRFEHVLSQKPVNLTALDSHVERLTSLLWEACYLHRGEKVSTDGASAAFWKEITDIVKEFQGLLQTSITLPQVKSVLLPALNAFMKGKRPAWQTEHERAMQQVYQPLLSRLKTHFVEWNQNPKTHSSRTLENSRGKLEGNLATLTDILTESMLVATQREAEGYRWTFQRYAREVEALLRGDVLPQRGAMPAASHQATALPSSSQLAPSTSSHSELDDLFINVRNGTPAQQRAFEVLGLALDVDISAAAFRQHWHAALREVRSPLMNVDVERERLDRVKAVIEAGQVINKLIDSELKVVREWKDTFEGELRAALSQLRQDIEALQASLVMFGNSIEECRGISNKTMATLDRVEKSSQESMGIVKNIGGTLDRVEAKLERTEAKLERTKAMCKDLSADMEKCQQQGQARKMLEEKVWALLREQDPALPLYQELVSNVSALPSSSSLPGSSSALIFDVSHGEISESSTRSPSPSNSKHRRSDSLPSVGTHGSSIWSKPGSQSGNVTTSEQKSLEPEKKKPTRRFSHSE
jgi:hypothetical protein